jgi:hypothetical protein
MGIEQFEHSSELVADGSFERQKHERLKQEQLEDLKCLRLFVDCIREGEELT